MTLHCLLATIFLKNWNVLIFSLSHKFGLFSSSWKQLEWGLVPFRKLFPPFGFGETNWFLLEETFFCKLFSLSFLDMGRSILDHQFQKGKKKSPQIYNSSKIFKYHSITSLYGRTMSRKTSEFVLEEC